MDKTSIAKKLFNLVVGKLHTIDDVTIKVSLEAKEYIHKHYAPNFVCGVFGKEKDTFSTGKQKEIGSKIIQRISLAICKHFSCVVLTGERIYYKTKDKIKNESYLNQVIQITANKEDRESSLATMSKIYGHIPDVAIFLIDERRAASMLEESAFHSMDRQFGLGIVICNKDIKHCKFSKKVEMGGMSYHECTHTDYEQCLKPSSKCLTKKMKISKTSLQPFINKITHDLIFIDELKDIEKTVMIKLKEIERLKSIKQSV